MIDILYIENKEQLFNRQTELLEKLIGSYEKDKALRFRRWQDRQAYLLGKLLVAKHLQNHGYNVELLKKISYTNFNRPYVDGTTFDFNISHSGEVVVCAFSEEQTIGVDIEQINTIDLKDFSYILNFKDKERIQSSDNTYSAFFEIWSAKEAVLKAEGCGLVDDLDKLEINSNTAIFNEKIYSIKNLAIDPLYSAYLASSTPIKNVNIRKVSANNCIEDFRTDFNVP